jgi:hypothetical protein
MDMKTSFTPGQLGPRLNPLAACLALTCGAGAFALDAGVSTVAAGAVSHSVATTRTVANCNETGAGSLRDAIAGAQSGDTIDMTGLTCGRITLKTGAISIGVDDLTLRGPGASALTLAGEDSQSFHTHAMLDHAGTGTLHIDSLQITDPVARGRFYPHPPFCVTSVGSVELEKSILTGCGSGAVYGRNGVTARYSTISASGQGISVYTGDVSIRSSSISNNSGFDCVALRVGLLGGSRGSGSVLISDSTISGNYGSYHFPAYYAYAAGCIDEAVTIQNSTIAFNAGASNSLGGGGAMLVFSSVPVTLESSIVANNGRWDLFFAGTVAGHDNLITATNAVVPADTLTVDPQLLPLADNGGPTLTHALAVGSPAIDAGNNVAALEFDQRGEPRAVGAAPDIGALEVQSGTPAPPFIGAGFTGNWFDPQQSGHGFSIEVLPGNVLLADWFVFAPLGGQAWIVAMGPITGDTAVLQGYQKVGSGGLFPPAFDATKLQDQFWGTITLTFTDCNNGTASWQPVAPGYTAGSMPLQRLTLPAGLTCP